MFIIAAESSLPCLIDYYFPSAEIKRVTTTEMEGKSGGRYCRRKEKKTHSQLYRNPIDPYLILQTAIALLDN